MNENKKFRKNDWLDLGLKQLCKFGAQGLTVERLCEAAKKTRGSFYHHFEDQEQYIHQLMECWKRKQTDDIIKQVEHIDDKSQRPEALSTLVSNLDYHLDLAVRQFSQNQAIAAKFVKQVDKTRIAYLSKLYQEVGGASEEQADEFARLEYAAFIGSLIIWPKASAKELSRLEKAFHRLVNAELSAEDER